MAKLLIEVVLDDKGAIKKVGKLEGEIKDVGRASDKASTKTEGLTKKFGGLNIGAIAVAAGLAAIGKVVGNLVNLFGVQEAAEAKLNQVLESTGHAAGLTFDELTKMASGLQEVTKFGDEATIEAQALLLTFTRIGRDIFPDALESIMDVATAMNTDLQSATIQIGKALNDPIMGMTALSRSGITFTQQQKDVVKTMVNTGDVAGAQAIIMAELNTQFGGQARAAADTFIGSQVQMKNAIGDLGEVLGEAFAPILRRVNNFIKDAAIATGNWLSALMAIEEILIDTGPIDIFTSSVGQLKEEIGLLDELITVLVDDMIIGALSQEAYNEQLAVLAARSKLAKDRLRELDKVTTTVDKHHISARKSLKGLNDETIMYARNIEKVIPLLGAEIGLTGDRATEAATTASAIAASSKTEGEAARKSIIAELSRAIMTIIRQVISFIPPPFSIPAAAAAAVALRGLVEHNIPKFALGGSALVGGSGLTDTELISFRATKGETLRVTTPEQEAERSGGGDTFVFDMRDSIIGAGAMEEIDLRLAELRDIGRSEALKVL